MERDRKEDARARRAARKTRSQQSVKPDSDTELPSSHSAKAKASQLQVIQPKPIPPPPSTPPPQETPDYVGFSLLFVICQLIALGCIAMIYMWTVHYAGGFGKQPKQKGMFNWHPLIMTFAFGLTHGNSILFYRAYKKMGESFIKCGTLSLYSLTGVLAIAGMATIAMSYDPTPKYGFKFYSIHGWIGYMTLAMYLYQFIVAVFGFGLEVIPKQIINQILPSFVFTGITVLNLGCLSGVTGVLELAFTEIPLDKYSRMLPQGLLLNFIATSLTCFAIFVSYTATYKKKGHQDSQQQQHTLTAERSEQMKIQ